MRQKWPNVICQHLVKTSTLQFMAERRSVLIKYLYNEQILFPEYTCDMYYEIVTFENVPKYFNCSQQNLNNKQGVDL